MNEDKFNVINIPEGSIEKLAIKGYLDAQTAPLLEDAIQNLVDKENYNILINFHELEYISSAGLGVFMSFIEQVREKGGDIKMAEMSDNVYNVFDLLGFPMLFDIDKSETEIIDKFNKKQVPQNDF